MTDIFFKTMTAAMEVVLFAGILLAVCYAGAVGWGMM